MRDEKMNNWAPKVAPRSEYKKPLNINMSNGRSLKATKSSLRIESRPCHRFDLICILTFIRISWECVVELLIRWWTEGQRNETHTRIKLIKFFKNLIRSSGILLWTVLISNLIGCRWIENEMQMCKYGWIIYLRVKWSLITIHNSSLPVVLVLLLLHLTTTTPMMIIMTTVHPAGDH